jgi:hypothetical protein
MQSPPDALRDDRAAGTDRRRHRPQAAVDDRLLAPRGRCRVRCAAGVGLGAAQQQAGAARALIHGIGRASVPNAVWDSPGVRSEADKERLRLVPYWTERAARRIGTLRAEAEIASFVDERLDGSGFFRGVKGPAIDIEGRVLAVAAHWVSLRTSRPGQAALDEADAAPRCARSGSRAARCAAVAVLTGHPQCGTAMRHRRGGGASLQPRGRSARAHQPRRQQQGSGALAGHQPEHRARAPGEHLSQARLHHARCGHA